VKAKGFKGIELIEMRPKKTVTVLGGKNRQGKSSLLDGISAALGGKKLCPEKPIRDGQDSACITVELDGEPAKMVPPITVTREFYRKEDGTVDSKLEIITKDGYKAPSPQTMLNDLMGKLGFDPESFLRMDPKKQAEVLRELVGLDFSELDAEYKKIYDRRTVLTGEGKKLKSQLEAAPIHKDAPDQEVSVSKLAAQLSEVHAANRKNEAQRQALRAMEAKASEASKAVERKDDEIAALEQQIAKARETRAMLEATHSEYLKSVTEQTKLVNALKDQDTSDIEKKIASAEELNRKVRENAKHNELAESVQAKQKEWLAASARLKEIEAKKEEMRRSAKWPVDGLGYDDTGVTYNGRPFAQGSSYEQRKVAMGICVALSPNLKFAFLKDGSLLDDESMIEFAELAAENGIQLFVERVGKGPECNIIIESGLVESADEDVRV
jgi:predicted ATP-dependent endonuclease of OLD family